MTPCDQCLRGILPGQWPPRPCPVCRGSGVLTLSRLSKLTGTDEKTLKNLWRLRTKTRVKTAQRVLLKICELTAPKQGRLL
jgi:hypothetical protein